MVIWVPQLCQVRELTDFLQNEEKLQSGAKIEFQGKKKLSFNG